MNEPALEPNIPSPTYVRCGALRPCSDAERTEGAPDFACNIDTPVTVRVYSKTFGKTVEAVATAVSPDRSMVFVWYTDGSGSKWARAKNLQPPLVFDKPASAVGTAAMGVDNTAEGATFAGPRVRAEASRGVSQPSSWRSCSSVAVILIAGAVVSAISAGCGNGDREPQKPDTLKMHRPLLDRHGVAIDERHAIIYIQPSGMSMVHRSIGLPPGSTMQLAEVASSIDHSPGASSLRIACTLPPNEQGQIEERTYTVGPDRSVTMESRIVARVDGTSVAAKP